MQMTVLAISLVVMALISLVFIGAIRSGGRAQAPGSVERRRLALILAMLAVGIVVTIASLRPWPQAVAMTADTPTINVTGGQWYWEIDNTELPQGVPVIFNAHTEDVTHGFGVMNDVGRLLFQVQVMPGYVNQVQYVFDTPGEYTVVCLEYCGVAHHAMITDFTVVTNQGGDDNG
ncbi:cytochrome C oxidase subunit I [Roseovarius sp. M141]|uniref:cytochrome C oxidase subunit I n=1 Tax=Roseovarius sp. M141 TaxID=2583806 RepID=UPI0020CF9FFE|nr:cytochrome C oxidase subunit I [Roseovarius sp. M141]MCQ0093132.1 cytochrome c oxidase subunit I [Roseovarius sp. M141]